MTRNDARHEEYAIDIDKANENLEKRLPMAEEAFEVMVREWEELYEKYQKIYFHSNATNDLARMIDIERTLASLRRYLMDIRTFKMSLAKVRESLEALRNGGASSGDLASLLFPELSDPKKPSESN